MIKKILLVGGTHGNEATGIFLIKKWQQSPHLLQRDGLVIDTLLANPAAIAAGKRYLDKDLNRCFSAAVLNDTSLQGHEIDRAHELVNQLGAKGQCHYDLIIDLHTSTANMGVNLVLTQHDKFHHDMMAYMLEQRDDVVVTSEAEMIPDHHFLCALAQHNLIVEVGPVAQNLLHHESIEKTEQAVTQLLDFIELYNANSLPSLSPTIEVFEYTGKVYYPVNEDQDIIGVVHSEIQGQDFSLLNTGGAIFKMQDGSVITHRDAPTYISFVNEAAYYDQRIAFCTLDRRVIQRQS
ncbi:MAG: aspartoacylase [Gammaproteobacteria bacterium]|nr:aspartoacylase [Gammaproteobacteria bacterium]